MARIPPLSGSALSSRLAALEARVDAPGLMSVTPTGATTARSLAERFADVVNVKDFLPANQPDGTTDNTAGVNAAITEAAGLREVVFPGPGTYIVKGAAVNVAGTTLRGTNGATLKLPALAAGDGSPILAVTASSVTIRGLAFDGNRASQPADGFSDSWSGGAGGVGRSYRAAIRAFQSGADREGLTVAECAFRDTYGAAVAAQRYSHVRVSGSTFADLNFEAVWVQNAIGTTDPVYGVEVTGCDIRDLGTGHASVNANGILVSRASNVVIAGNRFDTIERNALKCEHGRDVSVSGNVIRHITVANFGGINLWGSATNAVVSGNTVHDAGSGIQATWSTPGDGYFGVSIANNSIDTTTGPDSGDGIIVAGSALAMEAFTINGNTIRGAHRHGINFGAGADAKDVALSNNVIYEPGGSGIRVAPAGEWWGLTISGNSVKTSLAPALDLSNEYGGEIYALMVSANSLNGGSSFALRETGNAVSAGFVYGNMLFGYIQAISVSLALGENVLNRSDPNFKSPVYKMLVTPLTVHAYWRTVLVDLTTPGAPSVTLPNSPPPIIGQIYTIKDAKGDAAANNITINRGGSSLIDGATTKVIAANYGSVSLVYDGTNWYSL